MISRIALFPIFGQPLLMYTGILVLLSLLFTASIGFATLHKLKYIPFKYHPPMAAITITLAFIHGLLGLAVYLNF